MVGGGGGGGGAGGVQLNPTNPSESGPVDSNKTPRWVGLR